jgi:hypothetical protein
VSGQYNVYKSNEFLQFLLTEKISDNDSTVLFEMPYRLQVPELIFWFFTRVASIDMPRAMIMIFQAFARENKETSFTPDTLLVDDQKPGGVTPGTTSFTVAAQSGGGDDVTAKMEMGMEMGQSGGKWIKGDAQPAVDGKATGNFLWKDDKSGATYVDTNGNPEYQATAPVAETVKERTHADLISGYIERLIAILRINNLSTDQYLKFLTSQLTAAKIKYQSNDIDNRHLFSASIATQHQAEAIMTQHKDNAEDNIDKIKTEREKAREATEEKAELASQLEHDRKVELLKASSGKGTTSSRSPFDLSSLLNRKPGSNIDNELGTCISGNNAIISCDGKTIRIDLDLATLLSTCADSFTQGALSKVEEKNRETDEAKKESAAKEAAEAEKEGKEAGAAGKEAGAAVAAEKEGKEAGAAAATEKEGKEAGAAAATEKEGKEAGAAAEAVTAKYNAYDAKYNAYDAEYNAYDAEYKKFISNPVVKYLEYNAAYYKFIEDAKKAELQTDDDL